MKLSMPRLIVLAAAMAVTAAGPAFGHATGSPGQAASDLSSDQTRVPGEYLVTLVTGADSAVIAGIYGHFGIKGIQDLGRGIFLVTLTEDPGPEKMEELRGQNARIKAVQPNFVYRANEPGHVW